MSMPRVGSSMMTTDGFGQQHFGEQQLLLVAAGQFAGLHLGAFQSGCRSRCTASCSAVCLASAAQEQAGIEPRQRREGQVRAPAAPAGAAPCLCGLRSDSRCPRPSPDAANGSRMGLPSSSTLALPGRRPITASNNSVRPAPIMPAKPRISPLSTQNETPCDAARHMRVAHAEQRLPLGIVGRLVGIERGEFAPDHQPRHVRLAQRRDRDRSRSACRPAAPSPCRRARCTSSSRWLM